MEYRKTDLYSPRFVINCNNYKLYELAEWINGRAFSKKDYSTIGLPVIKISELNNGISSNTKYATNIENKYYIKKNDILFAWSGNPETSINTYKFNLEEGYLNQHIFKTFPKEEIITANFFYYLMQYLKPNFQAIASNKQTTGLGHVTISDIKKIDVNIPDKEIQDSIIKILVLIDTKIEINKKIIANLEGQAQAIFKSWFIDFDPFQDEEFVESELGLIPEGWEVKKLKEEVDLFIGFHLKVKRMQKKVSIR